MGNRKPVLQDDASISAADEFKANKAALLGATIGLGCGVAMYTPLSSIFFRALEAEFNWSKAASALSFVALPATALALPVIGIFVDRLGVRTVAVSSALCLAVSLFLLSMMSGGLVQFYLIFLAVNVLGAGTGPVAYTRLIAAGFKVARGLALSISLIGVGLVAMVLPPLMSHIISTAGWRPAYRAMALVALIGGGLAWLLIGRGAKVTSADAPRIAAPTGLAIGPALKTRGFWLLGGALLFISIASFGMTSQLQSIGIEKGLGAGQAALLISALGLSIVPSRLAVGYLLDVMDPRLAAAAALVLAAIGALVVLMAPPGSGLIIALGVAMVGFSIGAELDLMSYFCAHCFGLKKFGALYGFLAAFFYVGIAGGGISYGVIHDRTGGYGPALAVSSGLLVAAAVLLMFLPRKALAATAPEEALA